MNLIFKKIKENFISFNYDEYLKLLELDKHINLELLKNKYISKKEYSYLYKYTFTIEYFNKLKSNGYLKYLLKINKISNNKVKSIIRKFNNIDKLISTHNDSFIDNALLEEKEYLDTILKEVDSNIKLDKEQRRVILTDEDYSLVIAGAGAGKTTTLAAKIKYLVEKMNISQDEILVISFTNKAVEELRCKVNKDLNILCNILTFHSIGNEILKTYTNKKINLVDSNKLYELTYKYFNDCILRDKLLFNNLNVLFFSYLDILEDKNVNIKNFVNLICRFICNFKTNGYDINNFNSMINNTTNERTKLFLKITKTCYIRYQNYLNKNNLIDFEDMINESTYVLKNKNVKLNYKYIIVDEYQDISRQRFDLVKELSNVCNAKIMAVGDDWQSIYAFSGSDINLFTSFQEKMGHAKLLKIINTYRNSQEIIDIAGNFIQKNTLQIKKRLKSPKSITEPIIIYTYSLKKNNSNIQYAHTLEKALLQIITYNIEENKKEDSSILLLGRYNFDINKLIETNLFNKVNDKIISKKYPLLNITFMSAHSSKGLGFDNVIIINCMNDTYGFPSKLEDDPILSKVIKVDTSISYAEERRLFYVAMTRTKNRVYFITPEEKPSEFLLEIKHDYKNVKLIGSWNNNIINNKLKNIKCPLCNYKLQFKYSNKLKLKLYICTNTNCDFITNLYNFKKLSIKKCNKCQDGYLIVKKSFYNNYFLECTNYKKDGTGCNNIIKDN